MRSKPHKNQPPSGAEPLPPPENPAHSKSKTPMGNFRALLMKMSINSSPNKSLSPAQKIFVHQKLHQIFPDSKSSPDHPPYSWMILKAIENLDEAGGSTEEKISKYIVKENPNLPWAHPTLLSHHIAKLCQSDEIFEGVDGYYQLTHPTTKSSPNECISSDKKRTNPKNMEKKDSKMRKGNVIKCNVGGEKLQMIVENEAKRDFVSRECYEDEEKQPNSERVCESGKRRTGKEPKRKRRKMILVEEEEEEEEEIKLEVDVKVPGLDGNARKEPNEKNLTSEECKEEQELKTKQGKQKGRRLGILAKRWIKKVFQEENNLEIDGAKKEPNKQMQRDFVSEKGRGEELKREREPEKEKRRSIRVPKRNRKNNDIEEQTNTKIHVVEELTKLESDFQPQEMDDAQNGNEQMQLGEEKGKRKLGRRHQHLQLQTCTPKTKSSEGLSTNPSARSLQSSNQKSLQLGENKNIKHEESAKPQEIRRSTRISKATSKKKEYESSS